jgi:hypothetical protein
VDPIEKKAITFGPKWIERIIKYIGSYNNKENNKAIEETNKKYIIGFSVYNDTTNNTYDATFFTHIDEEESDPNDVGLFVKSTKKNYVFSYYRVSSLDYTLLKSMLGKVYSLTVFNCQWTSYVIVNILEPNSQMYIAQNIKVGPMSQLTLHYLIKDAFIPNDNSLVFQLRYVGEFIALKKTRITDILYKDLVRKDGVLNKYMVTYYAGAGLPIVLSQDNILRAILTDSKKTYNDKIANYTIGNGYAAYF